MTGDCGSVSDIGTVTTVAGCINKVVNGFKRRTD